MGRYSCAAEGGSTFHEAGSSSHSRGRGRQRGSSAELRPSGKAPARTRLMLHPLGWQQSNKCCPNLDVQRVLAGSHERLDLQILFERFEKQRYLPSVSVNRGNCRRTDIEMVGEQVDIVFLILVPNSDGSQQMLAVLSGTSGKANDSVLHQTLRVIVQGLMMWTGLSCGVYP
jgi:hypothetical protein